MKRFFMMCLFLTFTSLAPAEEMDCKTKAPHMDRWTMCEHNKDCVIVAGVCGTLISVNQGYVSEVAEYHDCASTRYDCMGGRPYVPRDQYQAVCVKQVCQLVDKNIPIDMH